MALTDIRIGIDRIKETEVYKKLTFIQKTFVKKSTNVKYINHSLNVIKNRGFEQWQKQSNPNRINFEIINELYKKL